MNFNNKKILPSLIVATISAELGLQSSHAATIYVDNNTCSLSNAIIAANMDTSSKGCIAGDGSDVIELPADSNITLNSALPTIETSITINANGSTIERSNDSIDFSIFRATDGEFILNDAIISNGRSYGGGKGGGLYCKPTIDRSSCKVFRSAFTGNKATTGGAIYMRTSVFRNNYHSIVDTSFENNHASKGGAAYILNYYGGRPVVISNSTFTNNSAFNDGGALYLYGYYTNVRPVATVTNSTLSGNNARNGGAIASGDSYNRLGVNLQHSTVIFNTASSRGGGIFLEETGSTLINNIISGNQASNGDEIYVRNSSYPIDNQYNVIGTQNNSGVVGLQLSPSNIIHQSSTNTIVETALNDNGGLTKTHALVDNSPAIDSTILCTITRDQTGTGRPLDGDGDGAAFCDSGSVEKLSLILPDLRANIPSGPAATFEQFDWLFQVSNSGTGELVLNDKEVILSTDLPEMHFIYSEAIFSDDGNISGGVSCGITDNQLLCSVDDLLSMPSGSAFDIIIPTQATTPGIYELGSTDNSCLDPNNIIIELSEKNNQCYARKRIHTPLDLAVSLNHGKEFLVNQPYKLQFKLENLGPSDAFFPRPNIIFSTSLPQEADPFQASLIFEYTILSIDMSEGVVGNLNCFIEEPSFELICLADSNLFFPDMTEININLQMTASQPRKVSIPVEQQQNCTIDPNQYYSDQNLKNNNCQGDFIFTLLPDLIFQNSFEQQ